MMSKGGKNTILAAVLRLPGVTQKTIAQAAGVSQSSVSAMLQCDDKMRPKTRAQIARAVAGMISGVQVSDSTGEPPPVSGVEIGDAPQGCDFGMPGVVSTPSILPGYQLPAPLPRCFDATEALWQPQYYHAETDDFVDLAPKMPLDEALSVAHTAGLSGKPTRVKGPAVELSVAKVAEALAEDADEGVGAPFAEAVPA